MTITPSLGNQTGQAVELPGYDTSTNASGILTSQVFGILNDKYTKEEIDNINSAINTAISKKQDKLTAGANIRIVDNVISAFNNHLFLHLDENDTEHQAYVYSFIKSNLEFYLFAEITYEGKVVVLPLVAIENNESLDLKGMYLKDDSTIVEVSAVLVANGNISVNTSEINLIAGSSDYNNLTNKPQINSVELSGNKTLAELGIQAAGNYALKSDIPTKVSELQNDSQFVTETALTDGLSPKADKTYVDEQLATKQPVGDYALKSEIPDVSGFATKEEVTTGLNSKQDTLVSGTNIKTINSQSLVGSGNIDTQDIPTLYVSRYKNVSDTDGFDKVQNAILTNKPFLIYFNLEEGNINLLCESALTLSGNTTITTVFHREFNQNPSDHKVYTVTITKNELPDVTELVHNYINYGTGTQPQIYTITVLTQEEYNALPTKDSNTQYLIVE